jgi:hypothetical protein
LRFYALRTRCGEARHADLPLAVFAHPDAPRCRGGYNVCSQCRQRLRSSCEDRSANPIRPRSETTRHIKSHRFVRSPSAAGHASTHALARCSATGAGPSRPGRTSGPSLCSSDGAPGVQGPAFAEPFPSQVCSRNGWPIISGQPGPRACSSNRHAPIDFRRVDRTACTVRNMRADIRRRIRVELNWLLGFAPVCGPCPKAPSQHGAGH